MEGSSSRTARRAWEDLPPALRLAVHRVLGGPPERFEPANGGFSVGGVVGVATSAAGAQLFVKAVPADHPAAVDYRLEARVARALPVGVPTPALLLFDEADGWVVLGFPVVPGHAAREPWHDDELDAALTALSSTARLLTPAPPVEVPTVAERMHGRCRTWRGLVRDGRHGPVTAERVGSWELRHLKRLAEAEDHWPRRLAGSTLLHFDLRHDNCLVRPDGTVTFVDWGRACLGPAWVDLVCLLLESDLDGRDPQRIFDGHDLGRGVDDDAVDGFLVALASYWTHAAALPPPDGAPHLRTRQEHSRRATLAWLAQRWAT